MNEEPLLNKQKNICEGNSPMDNLSFLQNLFFTWISPVLEIGQKKFLQKEMLFPVPKKYSSKMLLKNFSENWQKYKDKKLPLLKTLFKTFSHEIFVLFILGLISSVFVFANPIIINRVIIFAQSNEKPIGVAIGVLIAIFLSKFFAVLVGTVVSFRGNCIGVYVINTLSMKIFEKSLVFSLVRSKDYNEGKLVNILQTDLEVILYLFFNIASIIFLPLQIIAGLLVMYFYVDLAFLAGVAVIVLMSLLNFFVGRIYIKYQEQLMAIKDERIKSTNEMLNGIKHIKMSAQEHSSFERIVNSRHRELSILIKQRSIDVIYTLIYWLTPMLVTTFTFLMFVLMGNELDALKAFTVLSLFQTLSEPLVLFPYAIADFINCFISIKRIEKFLFQEEIKQDAIEYLEKGEGNDAILLKNGTYFWENKKKPEEDETKSNGDEDEKSNNENEATAKKPLHQLKINSDDFESFHNEEVTSIVNEAPLPPTLKNLFMKIPKGSFVAIVGSIGSGKTSFFNAILNEMRPSDSPIPPSLQLSGSLSYTSQKPWIQNLTIKENILFGSPFDHSRFELSKKLSCLVEDLHLLKHGDETMIGDKGVNLSGGQKARLSLARAIYADSDIYLFDDILAAVDAHVGKAIFLECFLKHLAGKTRVLITHALYYLQHVDYVYVFDEGKIVEEGVYEEIKNSDILKEILDKFEEDKSFVDSNRASHIEPDIPKLPLPHIKPQKVEEAFEKIENYSVIVPKFENENANDSKDHAENFNNILDDLILEEDRETGRVRWEVIKSYIQHNGGVFFLFLVVGIMFVWVCLELGSNLWLKHWVDSNDPENSSFYIKIYALFALTYAFCCAFRAILLFFGSYICSLRMHNNIVKALLLAPLNEFFDRVPIGRILNRLSKDLYKVDVELSFKIGSLLVLTYSLLAEIGLCIYAIKYWVLIPLSLMAIFMLKIQSVYMKCNRELVRLEAISKSPIVSFYAETLSGLSVIRAFSKSSEFLEKHSENINENLKTQLIKYAFDEWFTQRIAFTTFILVITITGMALFLDFDPSFSGLLLIYVFQIEFDMRWFISQISMSESIMISFERCLALSRILPEQGYLVKDIVKKDVYSHNNEEEKEQLKSWPKYGKIDFVNVDVRYRKNLDCVLKNINISIQPNEKVGVVGRTGAGKSTMILSLMRILEAVQGQIIIDGIDIKKLDLRDLRKKITVIPQDVYLFEGTLKENLDTNNEYNEEFLWKCLENVNLREIFEKRDGLNSHIKEQGTNVSAGEKQLIALCKAFLAQNKIILIDEATANIDLITEKEIQEVVREKFKGFTVLTIAHRINTILGNDKILVLEKGRVLEFDSPNVLLENQNSMFYKLWQDSLAGIIY